MQRESLCERIKYGQIALLPCRSAQHIAQSVTYASPSSAKACACAWA